jgi:hypothetical protein
LNTFILFLTAARRRLILYLNTFNYEAGEGCMYVVGCYASYLLISLTFTIWVARTLHKNGRAFLVDAFHGNAGLADSVNRLSVIGLCLINIGYVMVAIRMTENPLTLRAAIELVIASIGGVLLVLGITLFVNLFIFSRMRERPPSNPGLDVSFANSAPRA